MNFKPFISIICPVYNSELYLKKCVHSVINQKYSNWELILIDDGSTDNSLKLCLNFANKIKNIKVFNTVHLGPLNARIEGIKRAKGKYLMFLDSDDYLNTRSTNIINQNIYKFNSPDLVIINLTRVFPNKKIPYIDYIKLPYYKKITGNNEIIDICFCSYRIAELCRKIIKTSVAKKSIRLLENNDIKRIRFCEDFFLSYFLLYYCKTMIIIKNHIYFYRINESSTTHNLSKEDYYDQYVIHKKIQLNMEKNHIVPLNVLNLFKKRTFGTLAYAIKKFKKTSYIQFKNFVFKIMNDDFYIKHFKTFNDYPTFKSKMFHKLLIKRKFLLLWVLINFIK